MMPVFWVSDEGQVTSSHANEFKKKVYGAEYRIEAGVYGAVSLGGQSIPSPSFVVHVRNCVGGIGCILFFPSPSLSLSLPPSLPPLLSLPGLVFLLSMVCLVGLTVQQCRGHRPWRHIDMDGERTALTN